MIVMLATFRIPAEKVETARALVATMVAATRAEDGCVFFNVAEDLLDRGVLRLSECWANQAAVDAHAKAPHMIAWKQDRETLGILERSIQMYEAAPIERK